MDDADQFRGPRSGFGHHRAPVAVPDEDDGSAPSSEAVQGVDVGHHVDERVEGLAARQVERRPRNVSLVEGLSQSSPTPGAVPRAVDEDEGGGTRHCGEG